MRSYALLMTNASEPLPAVMCTLTTKEARAQGLEWVDLQGIALRSEALPTGARMAFRSEDAARVADLADREATCCSFLNMTTAHVGDEFVLEVTTENPDGLGVIAMLSGLTQT